MCRGRCRSGAQEQAQLGPMRHRRRAGQTAHSNTVYVSRDESDFDFDKQLLLRWRDALGAIGMG